MQIEENAGLRRVLLELYTPLYGAAWEEFLDANVRVRIDADRMFTFHMERPARSPRASKADLGQAE
jgi:hypothetical protein